MPQGGKHKPPARLVVMIMPCEKSRIIKARSPPARILENLTFSKFNRGKFLCKKLQLLPSAALISGGFSMQTIKYKFADATTNEVEVMEKDIYQTAAYIALRQKDGPPMINVPLYVKVSEVNKNGMTEAQESVMHRVSEIMIKRNKKTIKRYHEKKKLSITVCQNALKNVKLILFSN